MRTNTTSFRTLLLQSLCVIATFSMMLGGVSHATAYSTSGSGGMSSPGGSVSGGGGTTKSTSGGSGQAGGSGSPFNGGSSYSQSSYSGGGGNSYNGSGYSQGGYSGGTTKSTSGGSGQAGGSGSPFNGGSSYSQSSYSGGGGNSYNGTSGDGSQPVGGNSQNMTRPSNAPASTGSVVSKVASVAGTLAGMARDAVVSVGKSVVTAAQNALGMSPESAATKLPAPPAKQITDRILPSEPNLVRDDRMPPPAKYQDRVPKEEDKPPVGSSIPTAAELSALKENFQKELVARAEGKVVAAKEAERQAVQAALTARDVAAAQYGSPETKAAAAAKVAAADAAFLKAHEVTQAAVARAAALGVGPTVADAPDPLDGLGDDGKNAAKVAAKDVAPEEVVDLDLTGGIAPKYGVKEGAIPKPVPASVAFANIIRDNPNITVKKGVNLVDVSKETLSQIINAVNITGQKITINSGYADEGHVSHDDLMVKGKRVDEQKFGTALDIKIDTTGLTPKEIQQKTETFVKTISALGAKGIGIYANTPGLVHVDNLQTRTWSDVGSIEGAGYADLKAVGGWRLALGNDHIAGNFAGYNGITPQNGMQIASANEKTKPQVQAGKVELTSSEKAAPTPKARSAETPAERDARFAQESAVNRETLAAARAADNKLIADADAISNDDTIKPQTVGGFTGPTREQVVLNTAAQQGIQALRNLKELENSPKPVTQAALDAAREKVAVTQKEFGEALNKVAPKDAVTVVAAQKEIPYNPADFKQPPITEPFSTPFGYLDEIIDPKALDTPAQRRDYVMSLAVNIYGMPEKQAAAIAGNVAAESNYNPNAVGDEGTAFGMFQYRGSRLDSLKDFSGVTNPKQIGIDAQVSHALAEMQGTSPEPDSGARKVGKAFEANPNMSVEKSTELFQNKFERPLSKTESLDKRKESAIAALAAFTNRPRVDIGVNTVGVAPEAPAEEPVLAGWLEKLVPDVVKDIVQEKVEQAKVVVDTAMPRIEKYAALPQWMKDLANWLGSGGKAPNPGEGGSGNKGGDVAENGPLPNFANRKLESTGIKSEQAVSQERNFATVINTIFTSAHPFMTETTDSYVDESGSTVKIDQRFISIDDSDYVIELAYIDSNLDYLHLQQIGQISSQIFVRDYYDIDADGKLDAYFINSEQITSPALRAIAQNRFVLEMEYIAQYIVGR